MSNSFDSIYQQLNSGYIDEIFARYQEDPTSVGAVWQAFFSGFQEGFSTASSLSQNSEHFEHVLEGLAHQQYEKPDVTTAPAKATAAKASGTPTCAPTTNMEFEFKVARYVCAWKKNGHLKAQTNPLHPVERNVPDLELNFYGFSPEELKMQTSAGILAGLPSQPLNELSENLKKLFAGTIGVEFEHVENAEEKNWLYNELKNIHAPVNKETQKQIYTELSKADAVEKTIATKYIGKKRFSIEGADSQLVACQSFMEQSAQLGAEECTVAIAHRGRLNFLVNVAGKPLENLLAEFEGYPNETLKGDTDVKYHFGYESIQKTRNGKDIRVSMPFNPSHLEYVGPVVMGETRACQDFYYKGDTSKVASIVFHGDAAIAGQGIVYETAQMMSLWGYQVGGTVHVAANNQVGFTTNPADARSSTYCTDAAKVTGSPVFHVNADDLDGLHNVMSICAKYRAQFKRDIYVEIVCFRRFGHNEADEPNFTQPVLYKYVKDKPAPYETYASYLTTKNIFSDDELKKIYNDFREQMNAVYDRVKKEHLPIIQFQDFRESNKLILASESQMLEKSKTTYPIKKLKELAEKICVVPESFHPNTKLARIILAERSDMAQGKKRVDWGMAELLAYATLLDEGYSVRLSGEDCQRGTFSHRHVTLIDAENDDKYTSLKAINPNARVDIVNSLLSEEAVMGYEYGYAVRNINCLTIWEAQFGDFANGAQVIIDQFIASGETKWAQQQGLVLLLPHGLEGQGAEHSSARFERFLTLCAQGNMQVCYFTTGAQLYHAMRRQLLRNFRKPLVIMSPKSFLRSPRASCTLEDLATGTFQEFLDDDRITQKPKIERVLLCTGKIAFDLFDALEKDDYKPLAEKVAIVRIEQVSPFHAKKMTTLLAQYKNAKVFWVQEEPKNMGAWMFIQDELRQILDSQKLNQLQYIGRSKRATPAVGLEKLHNIEQDKIIENALKSSKGFEI